ncbi:hypothetical protein GCM10009654_14560 [Streptomyces hebeiensis]|uniref:Uncharacterized protein n=1 Tax=Streptomyces hebeiensis TaxID=229486 RepID=A0ABN1UQ44_9ACTN
MDRAAAGAEDGGAEVGGAAAGAVPVGGGLGFGRDVDEMVPDTDGLGGAVAPRGAAGGAAGGPASGPGGPAGGGSDPGAASAITAKRVVAVTTTSVLSVAMREVCGCASRCVKRCMRTPLEV